MLFGPSPAARRRPPGLVEACIPTHDDLDVFRGPNLINEMSKPDGILLNYDSVRGVCGEIASAIGDDRLDRITETFRPRTRGLPSFHLMRARAHPLAVEWHYLQQEIERSIEPNLVLSEQSIFLLDRLLLLKGVLDVPGAQRILSRVEQASQYYSAMFEAFILARYRGLARYLGEGATVEVVEEDSVGGPASSRLRHDGVCRPPVLAIRVRRLEDHLRRQPAAQQPGFPLCLRSARTRWQGFPTAGARRAGVVAPFLQRTRARVSGAMASEAACLKFAPRLPVNSALPALSSLTSLCLH
jgi:hypothetical protein